jgi:hypothetical protein
LKYWNTGTGGSFISKTTETEGYHIEILELEDLLFQKQLKLKVIDKIK